MLSQSYVLQSLGLSLEILPSVAPEDTANVNLLQFPDCSQSKLGESLEGALEALDVISPDALVAQSPVTGAMFPMDEDTDSQCPSPALSFYTACDDLESLDEPCEDEKASVHILPPLFDFESRCATPTSDRSLRRARSTMDINSVDIESSPRNLFRRDSDPAFKDAALKSHILDLESKLAEANQDILALNQEVEELNAAREDQEAVLSGAEQQVEEVLQRKQELEKHFKYVELQKIELQRQQEDMLDEVELYRADMRILHEMIYTYQAMLIECGIAHSSLRFHNSLEAMRARLSHGIKVPREYPGLAPDIASTLAYASKPEYVPLPASPEPPSLPSSPDFLASMESHEYLEGFQLVSSRDADAAEALAVPRPGSPMPS